jgi:hypothetical protein
MQSDTWPAGQLFRAARWLPDWLRDWATRMLERQLERRAAPRRMVVKLIAHYWEGTGGAGHVVRDISMSGAFIVADFKWAPGTFVTITLQLEGEASSDSPIAVSVQTRVVRQTPEGIGVQFLSFDKAERQRLERFLQSVPDAPTTVTRMSCPSSPNPGTGEFRRIA